MSDQPDEQLREAARARGFRLVKSRRRKPGGDFGRYGLVELDSGRECMGFGKDGLTATAAEVRSYLRGGEVASWKRSLIGVVKSDEPKKTKPKERSKPSARPEGGRSSPRKPDKKEERATPSPSAKARRGAAAQEDSPPALAGGAGGGSSSSLEPTIREATRRDAAGLAKLLGTPAAILADRLAAAIRADEAPLVAEQDGLVGAVAWAIVPTLQHGPHGRITLLLVAGDHRRQGLGARLLAEAEQRLRDAGVERIELALDIDFDAPTGFLRRAGFTRTTNGYAKALG